MTSKLNRQKDATRQLRRAVRDHRKAYVALLARAERMREHILRNVVGRLCDVPSGRFHGEWGCGLCGGVGKGPASGQYDHSTIEHAADCMAAPLSGDA